MPNDSAATSIGFVGVALLLAAFLANLFHLLRADGHAYMGLNFAGAGLACYSSWLIGFMPFVLLEGVWGRCRAGGYRALAVPRAAATLSP
jgi:hypothetical protein